MRVISQVTITTSSVTVNGQALETHATGAQLLREVYRDHLGGYPKFFKMDALCRLGYVASELLLRQEQPRQQDIDSRAIILFNTSGSMANDTEYQRTIQHADDYFPSPAVFVYTLPNIVTGEIAIANHYRSETAFYLLPQRDEEVMRRMVQATLDSDPSITSVITGWVECSSPDQFEAELQLLSV